MLITLLPEQVSEYWPLFKGHIDDSLPPSADWGPYDVNNILHSLLFGTAQLWLLANDKQETLGFFITTGLNDISGVKSLWLYCVVIIEKKAIVDWGIELETLKKFAQSKGCAKIVSFIMNPKLIEALKSTDVETRFTFAYLNI